MKGEGTGRGGVAQESDHDTDFIKEKARVALQAGKILMEWKQRGISESDDIKEKHSDFVKKLKQGADEAILKEEVPPGYHEAIREYFDSLEKEQKKK